MLNLPQSNKWAARTNSMIFMLTIKRIWAIALSRLYFLEIIQIAMNTSEIPIAIVRGLA